MEKQILKAVEQAYRQGLMDAKNVNDINPYLLVSQVVAHQIVNKFYKTEVSKTLLADRWDAEEFLLEKGISNHPRVYDCNDKESYEVADLIAEFANRYITS